MIVRLLHVLIGLWLIAGVLKHRLTLCDGEWIMLGAGVGIMLLPMIVQRKDDA